MNRLLSTLSRRTRLSYLQHTNLSLQCKMLGHVVKAESEYTETPMYPPIEKVSLEEKWKKKKQSWHKKIQDLPTVEQKLIELNMPKYYGYFSVLLKEETLTPSCLDFLKFATRTRLMHHFPDQYYEEQGSRLEKTVNSVRDGVKELIILHFGASNTIMRDPKYKTEAQLKQAQNENFLIDLNNFIMKCIREDAQHLSPTSVDLRPRIEGFWWVGGFKPTKCSQKSKEAIPWLKPYANNPIDRSMRSSVRPTLALRIKNGLPEVLPLEAKFDPPEKVQETSEEGVVNFDPSEKDQDANFDPKEIKNTPPSSISPFETDPKCHGLMSRRKPAVIIPGFWPGEENEHGHLFLHARERVNHAAKKFGQYAPSFLPAMLQQRAVVAGFTQALSYALYQGFTPVNEVTHPIVQQSVWTDGQSWQFGIYQLNTCTLHSHLSTDNPRENLLWLSEDMKLFDKIEGNSVKGFNDEVLKVLCSMYLKEGEERQGSSPYLADYKYLMHHPAPEEYKEEFQSALFHRLSERPRHIPRPEILPWEYIYKIRFKTRPIERKTKFFENRWAPNPYTRRLDDYNLPYIPKVRRLTHKINKKPRLNSEHLFKHDWHTLRRVVIYSDDHVAFNTMNVNKETPPYYNGLLWSRGMANKRVKI